MCQPGLAGIGAESIEDTVSLASVYGSSQSVTSPGAYALVTKVFVAICSLLLVCATVAAPFFRIDIAFTTLSPCACSFFLLFCPLLCPSHSPSLPFSCHPLLIKNSGANLVFHVITLFTLLAYSHPAAD